MKPAQQTERLAYLNVVACLDALADAPAESALAETIRRRLRDAKRTWAAALHDVDAGRVRSCGGFSDGATSAVSPEIREPLASGSKLRAGPMIADKPSRCSVKPREVSRESNGPAGVATRPHDTHPRRPEAGIPL